MKAWTSSTLLTAPAFDPWEKFMLLSRLIEEVRPERAAEVLPFVASAAFVVVREMRGQITRAEAEAHLERARAACMDARQPAATVEAAAAE